VEDEALALKKVKILRIVEWNLSQDIHIRKFNMGILKDLKNLELNVNMKGMIATTTNKLL
jgi:hypothetical protein